jgi:hypothetical protein
VHDLRSHVSHVSPPDVFPFPTYRTAAYWIHNSDPRQF